MNTSEELKTTLRQSAIEELQKIADFLLRQEQESEKKLAAWSKENFPDGNATDEDWRNYNEKGENLEIEEHEKLLNLHKSFIRQFVALVGLGGEITRDSELSLETYGGTLQAGMIFHRHSQRWSVHS